MKRINFTRRQALRTFSGAAVGALVPVDTLAVIPHGRANLLDEIMRIYAAFDEAVALFETDSGHAPTAVCFKGAPPSSSPGVLSTSSMYAMLLRWYSCKYNLSVYWDYNMAPGTFRLGGKRQSAKCNEYHDITYRIGDGTRLNELFTLKDQHDE